MNGKTTEQESIFLMFFDRLIIIIIVTLRWRERKAISQEEPFGKQKLLLQEIYLNVLSNSIKSPSVLFWRRLIHATNRNNL